MTVQDKITPPEQLSEVQIRERLRPYVPEAIERLVDLMKNAPNDSVRLGAIKTLLSKVVPDLKSQEITGDQGGALIVKILDYGKSELGGDA
jgi:hypothetical protein